MSNSFNISVKPEIDSILTDVVAIKAKTALIPQNVRGKFYTAWFSTSSNTFVEALNVTGHGKILLLAFKVLNVGDTVEIRLTTDGFEWYLIFHTGDTVYQNILPDCNLILAGAMLKLIPEPQPQSLAFDVEFSSSLKIELRRSAGTFDAVACKVYYQLDEF
ncbi:unnamed protein product [marine sediment metagenome]|uniref:Uncharacterized protein n=1 Tax=marine sediment metagenome TaxID=412755 RepID=X1QM87_9ZZZZ